MKAIYANTWEKLTLLMLGYHHDHCHHYYSGLTKDVPPNLQDNIDSFKNEKYVFLYKEDIPVRSYVLYNVELRVYINLLTTNLYIAAIKMIGINNLELHHTKWDITNEAWADKHRIQRNQLMEYINH